MLNNWRKRAWAPGSMEKKDTHDSGSRKNKIQRREDNTKHLIVYPREIRMSTEKSFRPGRLLAIAFNAAGKS